HGQTTSASASDATGANPVEPKLRVVRNRPAEEGDKCTHRSCAYVDIGYENLTKGKTYTFEIFYPPEGQLDEPPTVLQRTEKLKVPSGSGVLKTKSFYGYPGADVKIAVSGGDLGSAKHSLTYTWPDANPG